MKNIITRNLIINIKKEECEELRTFTKENGIIMKIGEFEEYPTLFPTKITVWFDSVREIYIAALASSMYKLYAKNYVEIDFEELKNYFNC